MVLDILQKLTDLIMRESLSLILFLAFIVSLCTQEDLNRSIMVPLNLVLHKVYFILIIVIHDDCIKVSWETFGSWVDKTDVVVWLGKGKQLLTGLGFGLVLGYQKQLLLVEGWGDIFLHIE